MSELNDSLNGVFISREQLSNAYIKPAIVCELDLETRAGSVLGGPLGPNPLDPIGGIDPSVNPR
jgi:hypothetical protein